MKKLSAAPIYKALSLIMAAAMMFGCLPILAAAQEGVTVAAIQNLSNDSQGSQVPAGLPLAGIIATLALAIVLLWALLPRKSDELIPIEEYRRKGSR